VSGVGDAALRKALAEAALALAKAKPWSQATLLDLAAAAGRPVADFYGATLNEAVDCVEEMFDRAIAEGLTAHQAGESVRDRLFDLIMKRFEAMEPHRDAVLSIDAMQDRDPLALSATHQRHVRCARWVLALAGLEADHMTGQARAQGLGVIIGQARAAWRADTDGDFARTMASLDKNLRRAEEMFGRWAGFEARPKPEGAGEAS
jgi:AcrR family transcriptional regulator